MAKCSFCQVTMEKGTGKMYVKKDGKILYFCNSKCQKNMLQLKRKPRATKWTGLYHKEKEDKGTQTQTTKKPKTEAKPKAAEKSAAKEVTKEKATAKPVSEQKEESKKE